MTDTYAVTADELRQFVERIEQFESEGRNIADQKKEVMAEAKGRGYDTKVIRALVTLRRQKPDAVAEFDALMAMYRTALGMA